MICMHAVYDCQLVCPRLLRFVISVCTRILHTRVTLPKQLLKWPQPLTLQPSHPQYCVALSIVVLLELAVVIYVYLEEDNVRPLSPITSSLPSSPHSSTSSPGV